MCIWLLPLLIWVPVQVALFEWGSSSENGSCLSLRQSASLLPLIAIPVLYVPAITLVSTEGHCVVTRDGSESGVSRNGRLFYSEAEFRDMTRVLRAKPESYNPNRLLPQHTTLETVCIHSHGYATLFPSCYFRVATNKGHSCARDRLEFLSSALGIATKSS